MWSATSERDAVAATVIAAIDELEQMAAAHRADVPALHGWRRELFGEKALASSTAGSRSRSRTIAWSRSSATERCA
jgi:ribonuclease D